MRRWRPQVPTPHDPRGRDRSRSNSRDRKGWDRQSTAETVHRNKHCAEQGCYHRNIRLSDIELAGTPSKVQVNVGFGQGSFQSDQERAYYASPEIKAQILGKPIKGSGLSANQADASLAVLANDAVILTDESPDKPGPLKLAANKGAKIIHLGAQFASSSLSLGAFVASMV